MTLTRKHAILAAALLATMVVGQAFLMRNRQSRSDSLPLAHDANRTPQSQPSSSDFSNAPVNTTVSAPAKPLANSSVTSEVLRAPVMPAGHQKMLGLLADLKANWGKSPFSPMETRDVLLAELKRLDEHPVPQFGKHRLDVIRTLADVELFLGNEQAAIDTYTRALKEFKSSYSDGTTQFLLFSLGVAYLRMGETDNCCSRNTPDSCLFPIRGSGIHTERNGSLRAAECFKRVLLHTKPGSLKYRHAQWLLNVAAMTLGEYPEGIPAAYRLPAAATVSDEPFPRFMNIAPQLGLNGFNCAGGAIADDFTGDGLLDLFVSEMDLRGELHFFVNQGNGNFIERSREAGLSGLYGGLNCIQADYNNDGHLDVFILRGGWMEEKGLHPNSLLRNNGNGTFQDVTFDAGLAEPFHPTQTATWFDFDNDGDLDLYIGNESSKGHTASCQLFRNNRDETFTDIASEAGVTNDAYTKAVIAGDYNQDGLPDLYVSNLDHANRLYRNNGNGTFTDVAPELNVQYPEDSFPAWFWDYDNDGRLDIFVASYDSHAADYCAELLGDSSPREKQRLYRGMEGGRFEDVTAACHLDRLSAPMGANFGDLDNDGYLDFYLGTGRPEYAELTPNVMFHNQQGKHFADISITGGFGSLQKGHGVVFADFDSDGDQDVFEQMGGAFVGDKYFNALYENPGFGNHYIVLQLVGTQSNRSAIGARIRVDISENGSQRSIYRHVNGGGSFGGNPLRQSIGLGTAKRIDTLEIYWPTSGLTQRFDNVPGDQLLQIVEPESTSG